MANLILVCSFVILMVSCSSKEDPDLTLCCTRPILYLLILFYTLIFSVLLSKCKYLTFKLDKQSY